MIIYVFFGNLRECNVFMWSLGLIKNMSFPSEHREVVKMLEVMDLFIRLRLKLIGKRVFLTGRGEGRSVGEARRDIALSFGVCRSYG